MRKSLMLFVLSALLSGCSTLDQSFKLGATTGALVGAIATYGAERAKNIESPSAKDVGIGATVGLGLGLVTAYFVHQAVAEERAAYTKDTEVYFGDLPPSPFVIPANINKGGQ